jgi:hypothetical protein
VAFTLVWMSWANGSPHHELHGHDDARARNDPAGIDVCCGLAAWYAGKAQPARSRQRDQAGVSALRRTAASGRC